MAANDSVTRGILLGVEPRTTQSGPRRWEFVSEVEILVSNATVVLNAADAHELMDALQAALQPSLTDSKES